MMENIQINGQKIWGPPKGWMGPPPPHGTEVFIKNIPDDVFEDELYYLFSSVGRVYEVRLPVHWTGMNKGYAFVRYTKISEADAAIEKLNLFVIRHGREIRVERSLDNTRLFLSSVPNDKSGEELKSDLLTVVENVKTVYVYPALENPTMFRGYAFVEFVCHRDAAIAKRVLTPDVLFNLFEKKCIAAWANPLPFLSKETLKNINIIFMRNIPSHTKSISIRMAVDSIISPDNVHKVKRLNDYAFLTFKDHGTAERALIKIKCNLFLLGPKPVHVEWAIPRELANSVSLKAVNLEKDDDSEYGRDIDNSYPFLKLLDDYKGNQPGLLIEDYMSVKNLTIENTKNILLGCLPNSENTTVQQRSSKIHTIPAFNKTEAPMSKCGPKLYPLHSANQIFDRRNVSNQSCGTNDLIAEFRHSDSEDVYRDIHLKNWLQSLILTDQNVSCASSPTLTSPSTESSTNLSWKWDDSFCQLPSPGFDGRGYNAKTISGPFQQVTLF